ncbi:methyl-accepting chemotaxis protein [Tindallia californiensis]|uniref:Methyl-accepting chemotaxis protein n=1 Tax=Tindallia californiensis TaxID=159292 RepID=A0A1H3PG39_9FIRM|nr:methyl-accepting chemotaxis protein [Tindallia californiensis]SDY99913.1 methyl-accepting chemotaxis protein [Tindallia californiensis]
MKKTQKLQEHRATRSIRRRLTVLPLVIVLIAVLVIGMVSAAGTRDSMLDQMRDDGLEVASQAARQLELATTSIETITHTVENTIRQVSNTVVLYQDEISNEMLTDLANAMNVDELNYYDNNGLILYSNDPANLGWQAPSDHPAAAFASGSERELMEEIRESAVTDDYYKYGYVRSPRGGFVQAGVLANNINEMTEEFGHQNLVEILAAEDNIVFALFIDLNQRAVAHSHHERIGIELTDEGSQVAAVEGNPFTSEYFFDTEGVDVYDVAYPVFVDGQHIGAINIGFSMERVAGAIRQNTITVATTGIVAFVILGVILLSISRHIMTSISKTKEQLATIGRGDFTVETDPKLLKMKDEFGEMAHAIENMRLSIKEMVSNIAGHSEQVASSSEELSATSQQSSSAAEEVGRTIEEIANGATNQAGSTQEGVANITEMGTLIEKDLENVRQLNEATEQVRSLKDQGMTTLGELVKHANTNREASGEVSDIIKNTNESAEKIEEASGMIRSIAEQTNLLALNAAIEAARAGEQGRGFAVVAEEIRKLAEQSSTFTEEIVTVINELIEKTGSAVKTMEMMDKTVESQTNSLEATTQQFDGIAGAIESMQEVIGNINSSAREMDGKKNEIIRVMESLSAISQQNAAGTEEASASVEEQIASVTEISNASEELARLAEEMQLSISHFKI